MHVSKGFVPVDEPSEEDDDLKPVVVGKDFGLPEGNAQHPNDSSSSSESEPEQRKRRRHDSDESEEEPAELQKKVLRDEDGDIDLSDLEKAPVIAEKAGLQSASELKEFNR